MRNRLPLFLLTLLGGLTTSHLPFALAAEEPQPVREIFVPFDDLNVLLEGDSQRVFLTREEYEDLLQRAKQTPVEHAPRDVIVTAAEYDTTIADERATISGRLSLEVLEKGLHAIPLPVNNVGIRSAALDGEAASLGRAENGQPMLFVEGAGRKELLLELVTVLHTSAAQQSLTFQLPTPPATVLRLSVPGNVEIRSGAAVVSRTVDADANTTTFELLPPRGVMSLVMSLNNRLLLQRRVVMARSVIFDEITQAYERLHATVSLGVLHGAVDRFRFRVPPGFEVTEVDSPTLSRWLVEDDDNGDAILDVSLREPTTGTVVLNLSAMSDSTDRGEWTMPRLEPLDVANHVAVVGLLLEDRLAFNSVAPAGLIPINNAVLRQVLPESVFVAEPGAPTIPPIAAFYAPQADYALSARFTKPPARIDTRTAMLVTFGEQAQHARGTLTLAPSMEKLFAIDVVVPDGWQVTSVTNIDGSEIPFERMAGDNGQNYLHVRLPNGVAPRGEETLTLDATSIPHGWLDDWTETSALLPAFRVVNASSNSGAIAVQTQEDLTVRPDVLEALTPLGNQDRESLGLSGSEGTLAYRIGAADYSASFIVQRTSPRITARAFSFLRIEPEGLAGHYELIYDIQQARARRLSFELPASTPETLTVRGLDGLQVKETFSEVVDGRRRWTALLASARRGQMRLAVDFVQPLTADEPRGLALPVVQAADVEYQSATVAVEGNPEFDISIDTAGRKIDVGELVDADYQVGRRLLGAFGFVSEPAVTVDVFRRRGHGLPSAITQRAELVTLVSASGRSQTAARYLLKTKAAYLQVKLPPAAELWSASVDRKPAMPQRDGDDLLISLPPTTDQAVRDLQIVFETSVSPVRLMSSLETSAPLLAVRTDSGEERYEVPTADVQWHLVLPEGHQLVRARGTLATEDSKPRMSPVLVVAGVLYELAGGVGKMRPAAPFPVSDSIMPSARYLADDVQYEAGSEADFDFAANMEATTEDAPQAEPSAATAAPQEEAPQDAESPAMLGAATPQEASGEAGDKEDDESAGKYWALQGVRSLKIELNAEGQQVTFRSMGVAPQLEVTLAHQTRLFFAGLGLAALVFVAGVALSGAPVRRKVVFIAAVMVLAVALPQLIGLATELELSSTFDASFYAAACLVPYYLLVGAARWLAVKVGAWTDRGTSVSQAVATTAGMLLAVLACISTGIAQEAANVPAIGADDLLDLLQPGKPIVLPKDAIIIPYDPEDADGLVNAEKVLVPYTEYSRLWKLAFPDEPLDAAKPPAAYAFAGANYAATLEGEDYLVVAGQVDLDVYQDTRLEIPLPLGGVLERATLDGQPARLRMINSPRAEARNARPQQMQDKQASISQPAEPLVLLYVDSPGRKQLELAVRMPLQRSGGWRIVQGRLPVAPATELSLVVPRSQTEVRLAGVLDRSNYETTDDNESIATALDAGGAFSLQWRPKVAAGQVDQSLTARSIGVLDVQEDGIRLTWQLELQTRHSQRETFTVVVPQGYLVERVEGENVRGWDAREVDDHQQIDITLLKASSGNELIAFHLSRREAIGLDRMSSFAAPSVTVPDAVLHQGHLAIRRGPLLHVDARPASGLTLAEVPQEALQAVVARITEENPLPLRPLQGYRFATSTFSLDLTAEAYRFRATTVEERALEQMLLRIAERETAVESRFRLSIEDRALHQLEFFLPDGLELEEVVAPSMLDWALTSVDDRRLLTVYLSAGAIGDSVVDLRGKLPRDGSETVAVPRIEIRGFPKQTGFVVAQVDPSVEVSVEALSNAEEVARARVDDWLAEPQRELQVKAIRYRDSEYQATFRLQPRTPDIDAFSVTNARITPREIEETVMLQFAITRAGIREVSFLLPATLADAQISVPLLRQKTIVPLADDPDTVRVRIELQDEVIDELIVLIQSKRSLTVDEYLVPLPVIETGETTDQIVMFESAGRDEVVVTDSRGLVEVNRSTKRLWRKLTELFPGNITQAYAVRDDAVAPRFALTARERALVETAGARIGLATTLLVVDSNGAYRGSQEYRVDNYTEQFLEIVLPAGSELWTVKVANESVKPTVVPDATDSRQVRVPLIKTQTGDSDYPVVLKYGGHLGRFRSFESIRFPLVKTSNVNVELSHVYLRLPETHRWQWRPKVFGGAFGGTMRHVEDRGELAADHLSYQRKQLQQLMQVLTNDRYDPFAKVRAAKSVNDLRQLGLAAQSFHETNDYFYNDRLQKELDMNSKVLRQAQQELQQQQVADVPIVSGNGMVLQRRYRSQRNSRSRNVVNELGNNFDAVGQQDRDVSGKFYGFNYGWFTQNRLSNEKGDKAAENNRVQSRAKKMAPSPAKPDSQLKESFGRLNDEAKRKGGQVTAQPPAERRGELAQQIQLYEKQLSDDSVNFQSRSSFAVPGAAGGQGQVPLAGERLESSQAEGRMAQDGATRAPGRYRQPGGGGFGGGGFGGGGGFVEGMPGQAAAAALPQIESVQMQGVVTGLTSLDVDIPQRGREFFFTTPRGDIEITAQPIKSSQLDRAARLLLGLAALLVVWLVWQAGRLICRKLQGKPLAAVLTVAGVVSLCSSVFPVIGVLAIAGGVWMFIRSFTSASSEAPAAA